MEKKEKSKEKKMDIDKESKLKIDISNIPMKNEDKKDDDLNNILVDINKYDYSDAEIEEDKNFIEDQEKKNLLGKIKVDKNKIKFEGQEKIFSNRKRGRIGDGKIAKTLSSFPNKEKIIEKVMAKDPSSIADIISILEKQGFRVSKTVKDYFDSLLTLRSNNRKFVVPGKLMTKKLKKVEGTNVKLRTISTDLLYLHYIITKKLGGNGVYLSEQSKLTSFSLVSTEKMELLKEQVKEYYIQDYDSEVFFSFIPTNEELSEQSIKNFNKYIEKIDDGSFSLDGKNYSVYKYKNRGIVIFNIDNNNTDIKVFQKTKFFEIKDKKKLTKGIYKAPKDSGFYYIATKINPTLFCPLILRLHQPCEFYMTFTSEFDSNFVVNQVIANKAIPIVVSEITAMYNFEVFLKFLGLFALFVDESEFKSDCLALFTEYLILEPLIKEDYKIYKNFNRICDNFIDIYGYNIKVSKIKKTIADIEKLLVQISTRGYIEDKENFKNNLVRFINKQNCDKSILVFYDLNIHFYCQKMLVALKASLFNRNEKRKYEDPKELVLEAGNLIFELYLNGSKSIFKNVKCKIAFTNYIGNLTENALETLIKQSDLEATKEKYKNDIIYKSLVQEEYKEKLDHINSVNKTIRKLIGDYKLTLTKEQEDKIKNYFDSYTNKNLDTVNFSSLMTKYLAEIINKKTGFDNKDIIGTIIDDIFPYQYQNATKIPYYKMFENLKVNDIASMVDILKPYLPAEVILQIYSEAKGNIENFKKLVYSISEQNTKILRSLM